MGKVIMIPKRNRHQMFKSNIGIFEVIKSLIWLHAADRNEMSITYQF